MQINAEECGLTFKICGRNVEQCGMTGTKNISKTTGVAHSCGKNRVHAELNNSCKKISSNPACASEKNRPGPFYLSRLFFLISIAHKSGFVNLKCWSYHSTFKWVHHKNSLLVVIVDVKALQISESRVQQTKKTTKNDK